MPDYAEPFGKIAGAAGGAAGAGAGGLLGQMLGGLNMPRNALWAMPGRLAHGDLLGAAPGLAGLAAGGLTAATGFGAPFAGLVGSAVGGLGEGIEEAMRPDMEKAPEASDLVKQLGGDPDSFGGQALGMGLSMAGDPLSYAGGLGGEAAGKAAGEAGGHFLEGAAAARGPRYPGGPEKLTGLLDQLGAPGQRIPGFRHFEQNVPLMLQSPEASRLLQEIEPGSSPVAAGMEGIVLKRPSGGVTRIAGAPGQMRIASPDPLDSNGFGIDWNSPPPPPRPNDPAMLQNARDVPLGTLRAEHMPEAQFGKFDEIGRPQDELGRAVAQARLPLTADVASRGRQAVDMHGGNIGRTAAGKLAIVDPGNILLPEGETQAEKIGQAPPQGWFTNKLLDLLGADKGVQNDINMGVNQIPTAGISPGEAAAFHQQQKDMFAAAMAKAKGDPAAVMPPAVGANAGLPTNVPTGQAEQASELMKALGLSPGGGGSSGGPASSFGGGSLDMGSPGMANFSELPVEDQQHLLRELIGRHDDVLGQANEQAAAGLPVANLMGPRNALQEQLADLVGKERAGGMLEHGTPSGLWPPAPMTGSPWPFETRAPLPHQTRILPLP